jgi:PAS domain S-box-containing protein
MPVNCQTIALHHILYVDDEPDLLTLGKLYLERNGDFRISTALSAHEGLEKLAAEPFDAIISDYQMPGMDGIALLKEVRTLHGTIPFILFTGKGREEVVIEALNSGADFYLQKGGAPQAQFAELRHKLLHAISRNRADRALKSSERDYRLLIEHANDAISVVQDGVLRMINPRSVELTGYSEHELLGHPFTRFVHPEDSDMLLDQFDKWLKGEEVPTRYTIRLCRKDGTTRWVEMSAVGITWDERPAIMNFKYDITDRKLAEDALRASEKRYRDIFESFEDLYFQTDMNGIITLLSPSLERLTGWTQEALIGKPVTNVYVYPEARKGLLDSITKNGRVRDFEVLLLKQDGTQVPVALNAKRMYHADGTPAGIAGILRNITRLKQVEDALQESEEKVRSLIEHAFEGILILDPSREILVINSAAARLAGLGSCEWLVGRDVMEFIAPESREDVLKDFDKIIHGHPAYPARYHLVTATGKKISVESVSRLICWDGRPADLITFREITGGKNAEA